MDGFFSPRQVSADLIKAVQGFFCTKCAVIDPESIVQWLLPLRVELENPIYFSSWSE